MGLAAAAALVAAVAIPRLTHRDDAAQLRFRGSGIHALAPDGAVDRDAEFVWSSAMSAGRYRIEVGTAEHVIYTTDTTESRLQLPRDVRESLRAGVDYWWKVTALDGGGQTLESSERRTFNVRAR